MSVDAQTNQPPEPPKGEHIFPATQLTDIATAWKEAVASGREQDAMELLTKIIVGTRPMLERLAQHEGFHNTTDLGTLVAAAESKIVHWLKFWDPRLGKLFSYFSGCARRAFLSEVQRVNVHRQRFHSTSDNLETFYGSEDFELHRHEAAEQFRASLKDLTARWGSPQELGAIHYLIECVLSADHNRRRAITAVCYAWAISPQLARFFYTWVLFALRNAYYEKVHVPFTEQDVLRHLHSYTMQPDIIDIIGWPAYKRLIMTMGGQRIKLPTVHQLAKEHADYRMMREIDQTPLDPGSVETIGKKFKRSFPTAAKIYEDMLERTSPLRSGEHPIYEG